MSRLLSDYGMVLVLLALGAFFCVATWAEQHPNGPQAARRLAATIADEFDPETAVLIVVRDHDDDIEFAAALESALTERGLTVVERVQGQPADARRTLNRMANDEQLPAVIACTQVTSTWQVLRNVPSTTGAASPRIVWPQSYHWPNFLKADNLLNIANQIAVIAIIAIGMTLVIITRGIDLSVGSLIALAAVTTALLIRDYAGAEQAGALGMTLCSLAGLGVCVLCGLFTGGMVTLLGIPPFIVTLGMMLVASGLAYLISDGQSINQVPDSFIWLGRGGDLVHIPNAVVLMLLLYAAAHVLMNRTVLGRYIYAVGGNPEAAGLSGVPVRRVLLFVYALCGALAGLGGVIMASQLKSGAPTYGQMYELYVIAAAVVGGTSLAGGEGRVLGTLVGALVIAVIQNGMNLTGIESYTQKVVLGLVILGAVTLDRLKRRS